MPSPAVPGAPAATLADPVRRRALALSALLTAFLIVAEAGAFSRPTAQFLSDSLQTVLSIWAGVTCLVTARARDQRRFWTVLGAGILMWATGQAI